MGDLVHMRDFKRKEERRADLVRLAKEVMGLVDTAPSEMPPVQPNYQSHNETILERMRGIPANVGSDDAGPGCPFVGGAINAFTAPDRDPA